MTPQPGRDGERQDWCPSTRSRCPSYRNSGLRQSSVGANPDPTTGHWHSDHAMDQVEGQVLVLEHVDDAVQREVGVVQEVDRPTAFAMLD